MFWSESSRKRGSPPLLGIPGWSFIYFYVLVPATVDSKFIHIVNERDLARKKSILHRLSKTHVLSFLHRCLLVKSLQRLSCSLSLASSLPVLNLHMQKYKRKKKNTEEEPLETMKTTVKRRLCKSISFTTDNPRPLLAIKFSDFCWIALAFRSVFFLLYH